MKIFISYGHDFQHEAKTLTESLKNVGFDVWIDYENLLAGQDWRDEITEAILECDYILVLLSFYGLRNEGVCLDELAIALSCNRRSIRPIKMEKSVEQVVPPAIAGIQFFDLSDWREISSERFDTWYNIKFNELVRTCFVKSTEYERKLQVIKSRLHYSQKFSREFLKLNRRYKRREWLDSEIKKWLTATKQKICFLIGFPGFGKSCFCANYYHYNNIVAGLVFCEKDKQNGIATAIKEISFQLAARIPAFATRLEHYLSSMQETIESLDNAQLFNFLLLEPLNLIDGNAETLLFVIDGVDQLSVGMVNELIDLFYEKRDSFPGFIRILFTTRQAVSVLAGKSSVYKIFADPNSTEIFTDIKEYVTESISSEKKEEIGLEIAEASQGSFLYAATVCDGIKSGDINLSQIGNLPNQVADMYYVLMSQIVSSEDYLHKYYNAVSLICIFENPPLDFIKRVLDLRQVQLLEFLGKFSIVFMRNTDKFGNLCVCFYSNSFVDWIKNEEKSLPYTIYEEDALKLATSYLFSCYERADLTLYENLNFISALKKGHRNEMIMQISADENFYKKAFEIINNLQRNSEYYEEWTSFLTELLDLFNTHCPYEKRILWGWIDGMGAYLSAKGEFICGDLIKCGEILNKELSTIKQYRNNEIAYLDSLYMLGTVYDYKGDRKQSVEIFQQLYDLSKIAHPDYAIKGLAGLVWNDHFNNIVEGREHLTDLMKADINDDCVVLRDLTYARVLQSVGEFVEAISIYDRVLKSQDNAIWKLDIIAKKNQMLLVESVVAAYDFGDIERAVNYGEKIYEKLKGTGVISECYCLSWLSLAYFQLGDIKKAFEDLDRAKAVLSDGGATRSLWLKMHLTSIEASFLRRGGAELKSMELYKQVEHFAQECNDIWVCGDACFDIFSILYKYEINSNEMVEYANRLSSLSVQSQLPHLLYKSKVASLILKNDADALEQIHELENIPNLPSVDTIDIAHLLYKKALEINSASADIFKKYIKEW